MTDDLLPRRQRTLCRECRTDTFGPPEVYTFQNWHPSACSRSRKYHRRQAILRQPGTTTYRDGQAVRDVPLPEDGWGEAVNVAADPDVPGRGNEVSAGCSSRTPLIHLRPSGGPGRP